MTDKEKIEVIVNSLTINALGDINHASAGGSKMGAFILSSCLIDAISGFEKGADTTKADYIAFVQKRLPSYDATKLYEDLRCKLVHSYSEGGSYSFVDGKPQLNGNLCGGKTIINLENFVDDITTALSAFTSDIRGADHALRANAIARLDGNGVIRVQTVQLTEDSLSSGSIPLSST